MEDKVKDELEVVVKKDPSTMELQELADSPKFPRRLVTQPSTEPQVTPDSGAGEPRSPEASESGDSSTKGKTWLHFHPLDFLSRGKKQDFENSGSSSPVLKHPGEGSKLGGEAVIEKPDGDGVFTLAEKDRKMLERIAQKAHDRALRVREPHEVFVELEEIRMDTSQEIEWAETARWIKFEEEVEEGSGRWGRPHISALAFHSLVELQQGLDKGCCLLDISITSFPALVDEIVHNLVQSGLLAPHHSEQVKTLLLKRHTHNNDKSLWDKIKHSAKDGTLHQIGEGFRRMSSSDIMDVRRGSHDHTHNNESPVAGENKETTLTSLPLLMEEENEEVAPGSPPCKSTPETQVPEPTRKVSFSLGETLGTSSDTSGYATNNSDSTHHAVDIEKELEEMEHMTKTRLYQRRGGSSVLSKIPDEAESLTVLVGGVNFLQQPITVFVRLDETLHDQHGDLVEANVPLRFLFLHIGPDNKSIDYHEVGRAMATLMTDAHFHEVAYSADSKEELLDAMGEFLESSIVLPPGDWGEELLLPALHERNNLRKRKEERKHAVQDYQVRVTEPLRHSRRLCGGIWNDLKKLSSRYLSDFRDALTPQVFYSIIFIYISFLAPAIAFGGLMEEVTGNLIGETETLFATGLGGVLYGIFALQPLTVLAFTGPVLVFESIIFEFSRDYFNLPYLEWRAMTGLWLLVILLVLAVSELTFLVHHFTRFCEEIFTGVVALFFIYESCLSLFHIFERNPLCGATYPCGEAAHFNDTCFPLDDHHDNVSNDTNSTDYMTVGGSGMDAHDVMHAMVTTGMEHMENMTMATLPRGFRVCNQPNTALFSVILAVSTFFIAFMLRKLRFKNFLGKRTRRLVSDFGMLVAITITVLVAYALRNLIAIEVLLVPPKYSVSNPAARGWFINPFGGRLSIGAAFGAIVPALLLSILIFVENQLALILINKPEHKLRKPVGYHVDLALVAVLSGLCGILGMPFLCGAPVRSLQHLQALSVFDKKHAPGEKPKLLKIHEQRVTTIVVHTLIIFTPFLNVVLQAIPIAVVLGVFYYLAYASIVGVQLFTRVKLLFILPKHYPDVIYTRNVRTWKMHVYTLIQIFLVALLFGLKNSPAALAYPLVIVLLIPIRWLLGKTLYNKEEIEALDNEENAKTDQKELGEFEMSHVPY